MSARGTLFTAAAIVSLFTTAPALALLRPDGGWTPNLAAVQHLETRVSLPANAQPMTAYVRFYAGVVDNGRHIIEGVYLAHAVATDMHLGTSNAINIVAAGDMPFINDGGCYMVTVYYDVASDTVTEARCNGYA